MMRGDAMKESNGDMFRSISSSVCGLVYRLYVRSCGKMGFRYINDYAVELFGISDCLAQDCFSKFISFIDGDYRDVFLESIKAAANENKLWEFQGAFNTVLGKRLWFMGSAKPKKCGDEIIFDCILSDVTKIKMLEFERIEKRIITLSQPVNDSSVIAFGDLFNIEDIQKLQDSFSLAMGVASVITDLNGVPITIPSNFCRLCSEIIRCTKKGLANCYKSDSTIGRHNPEGPIIQQCLSGGLWDAGASITVDGKHIANWLIGQVRDESQTEEAMACYAKEIGADEKDFIEAFREVPSMSRQRFKQIAQFLFTLAGQLSAKAYQNIQQERLISEKNLAAECLKESEEKFRLIFEKAPYIITINSLPEGRYIEVNPKFLEATGLKKSEVIAQNFYEVVNMHDKSSFKKMLDEIHEKGSVTGSLHKITKRAGGIGYYLFSVYPVTLKNEKCLVSMVVDVTKQIEIEEELKKLNTGLEQKVFQQTEKIFAANENLSALNVELKKTLDDLSEAQNHLVQSEKFTALGQLAAGIVHELNTPLGAISSSSVSLIDFVNAKLHKILDFMASIDENDKKKFRLIMNEALSKPVNAGIVHERKARKEIQKQLESKLIPNCEFMASVIMSAGVNLEYLESISFFESKRCLEILTSVMDIVSLRLFAEIIFNASEKTSHVVGALRSYLQSDDIEMAAEIDIEKEIDIVLTLFYNIIKHGIDVDKKYGGNIRIFGCRQKLNQVWMNIINNAIHAMNYKGKLVIETEKDVNCVRIHFIDYGVGIPESIKDKIFEPFFTTKKRGEGIGLGLDICKKIIEKVGGKIYCESEPGKTKFSVELPLVQA